MNKFESLKTKRPVPQKAYFDVLATRPVTLSPDEICEYVLMRRKDGEQYVIWVHNLEDGAMHMGSYFDVEACEEPYMSALRFFEERGKR